ncbi:MAG: ATP-dependent DNA helicase RecG [Clostridia bacterium]|nr:ATP-dependent DNA helicase RecG [Clostridia bacterium]
MELTVIRGINEKRRDELNKLGIFDTSDLIRHFPRAYLDMRVKQPLQNAYHNDVVLTTGKIVSLPVVRYFRRGGMVKISCEQEGFFFSVIWFNQPYVVSRLKAGEEYLFYGRVKNENGVVSLINPSFEPCDKVFRLQGIVPQYQIKGSLTQKVVRDAIKVSVNLEKPISLIPLDLQAKYHLSDLYSAYKEVHNPTSFESNNRASDRIAVEEYFSLISAFKVIKGGRQQVRINKYNCPSQKLAEFIKLRFPFEFTNGQKKAVNEIYADMTGKTVMNRLMQGDVGSGKTAVAICSIFVAVASGYQAVMLAPTEVLAVQNYNALKKAFPNYNVSLLTGALSAKEKRIVKAGISSGFTNIVVGTHALLSDDVEFKNLSLCVCDEQQRFGVAQRSALLSKGQTPDVLVMSATPIPRTLSLIFYGDLDVTTIPDKPQSRIPIQTNIVPSEKYNDMLEFIRKETLVGNQAYFVCPKIDGDEEGSVMSATELYEEIREKLPTVSIGLLHGKLKKDEKASVMQAFKNKEIMLLVSTTVIEVGVDVPDASVMVIYNAERFGLSALHQLRGRVGRSDVKSYCFLMTSAKSGESIERLSVIKNNTDGFKISEYDYKLRGSGDFLGDRQSGKFMKDLGCLNYGTDAIFLAKKISDEIFESGRDIENIKRIAIKKYEKLKDITLN